MFKIDVTIGITSVDYYDKDHNKLELDHNNKNDAVDHCIINTEIPTEMLRIDNVTTRFSDRLPRPEDHIVASIQQSDAQHLDMVIALEYVDVVLGCPYPRSHEMCHGTIYENVGVEGPIMYCLKKALSKQEHTVVY